VWEQVQKKFWSYVNPLPVYSRKFIVPFVIKGDEQLLNKAFGDQKLAAQAFGFHCDRTIENEQVIVTVMMVLCAYSLKADHEEASQDLERAKAVFEEHLTRTASSSSSPSASSSFRLELPFCAEITAKHLTFDKSLRRNFEHACQRQYGVTPFCRPIHKLRSELMLLLRVEQDISETVWQKIQQKFWSYMDRINLFFRALPEPEFEPNEVHELNRVFEKAKLSVHATSSYYGDKGGQAVQGVLMYLLRPFICQSAHGQGEEDFR